MHFKNVLPTKTFYYTDLTTFLILSIVLYYSIQHNIYLKFGQEDSLYFVIFLGIIELLKSTIVQLHYKTLRATPSNILRGIALLSCFSVAIYTVAVLLGAPAFSHAQQTTVLALLVTTLGVLSPCLNLGIEATTGIIINVVSYDCEGAQWLYLIKLRSVLFGSWLGAIVIPLDWNRAWQEWPIPCCMGAILGYLGGCLVCTVAYLKEGHVTQRKSGKYAL